MLNVVSVGYRIDHDSVTNVGFVDKQSFLDADILVADPRGAKDFWGEADKVDSATGRRMLRKRVALRRGQIEARRKEVGILLSQGKVVVVFLRPAQIVDALGDDAGGFDVQVRGSITNYDWLPAGSGFARSLHAGSGRTIRLVKPSHPFAPYYSAFKDDLRYEVFIDVRRGDSDAHFMVNKAGRPVAFMIEVQSGYMVFVPPPPENVEPDKLVGVVVQCARPLIEQDIRTPEPEWCAAFPLTGEDEIRGQIEDVQVQVQVLQGREQGLQADLRSVTDHRALLYEKGKPLETAVIRALRLLGFTAEPFAKEDLAHDVVLEASEGRAVAEIEGRDDEPIRIGKLDQLSRVVDEDFDEREEYSHGVLIGNPYRLTDPAEREAPFTAKVLKAAERKRFGLLTTIELFRAVRRVLGEPHDEELKSSLRRTILETAGAEVLLSGQGPMEDAGD